VLWQHVLKAVVYVISTQYTHYNLKHMLPTILHDL